MASSDRSTLICVAIIGVIGTLGAAVITNPSIFASEGHNTLGTNDSGQGNSGSAVTPAPDATTVTTVKALTAPHAPEIQLNQSTEIWGENTKLLEIAAGEERSIDGRDLFASITTFPQGNCLGPEYIAFTWQVRDPYPEGGDLEVKQVFQGGSTQRVSMGAMGSGQMGPCEIRIFKNNGLLPTKVELRYASAIDREPLSPEADPANEDGEPGVTPTS